MHAAHLIPDVALARVLTGGGPYRPGDDLSLAFTTPTVSRLVAHDTDVRAKCVPLEGALVPEMISVVITHCAVAYASGDVLTLSFVDPRIARVHRTAERRDDNRVLTAAGEPIAFDDFSETLSLERVAEKRPREHVAEETTSERRDDEAQRPEHGAPGSVPPANVTATADRSNSVMEKPPSIARADSGTVALDVRGPEPPPEEQGSAHSPTPEHFSAALWIGEQFPMQTTDRGTAHLLEGAREPVQLQAGERMTLREDQLVAHDGIRNAAPDAKSHDVASRDREETAASRAALIGADSNRVPSTNMHVPPSQRVVVRLEWKPERLRRFVQVVDKLFTIDRLGWYRHSLAMRLLIPDEITCGDTLAGVEAMRHLQALRTAAVESLGKPLLAACMPGFSISSEWLETLENSREARAIAGLREALLPYSDDRENAIDTPEDTALCTIGMIARRELLAENATSVEAFLPLLIPTTAHDPELSVRLAEYRRLLVELFTQTARAGESVRLHQMAQPNHSLDDRLWQLVGATAEAFGGFAHA